MDPPGPLAPRAPRRHRRLTVPAGLLLFACLALPGYRDCGHSVAMTSDPVLVAICGFGLVAAALSLTLGSRTRGERAIAISLIVGAGAAAILLGLEWLGRSHAYAGVTLGTGAAVCLVAGAVVWEREARGRDATAHRLLRAMLPLALAAVAALAALSDWVAEPDDAYGSSFPYLGPR